MEQFDVEVERPVSWSEQVEAVEERGELEGGPMSTLPSDEPVAHILSMEEETIPEDPPSSPHSLTMIIPSGKTWPERQRLRRSLWASQKPLPNLHLTPGRQHYWILSTLIGCGGEEGISANVHALIHDHGMDYSAAALDLAMAWLLLQRRDIAAYLRAWLARRLEAEEDPRDVLRDLNFHLLALEQA